VSGYPSLHWTRSNGWSPEPESLAFEEPLAIEIAYERRGQSVKKLLAITMRTPGSDAELALGFLLGEGVIGGLGDVSGSEAAAQNSRGEIVATRCVSLAQAPREDVERVSRGLITSSACGVCGRSTLAGLPLRAAARTSEDAWLSPELIAALPDRLREQQATFARTGGTHGAALFDPRGQLLLVREDVGRHNAVDKLIGAALLGKISPAGKILVLSGRVGFELMQKAVVAGVEVVVAVGAPSSIAVNLAQAAGVTLIGFTRGARFNVYAHAGRVQPGDADRIPRPLAAEA
jgi:FdhD protein